MFPINMQTYENSQYNDARAMAAFDPIMGNRFGRSPNASSKRSMGSSPLRRVSKLKGWKKSPPCIYSNIRKGPYCMYSMEDGHGRGECKGTNVRSQI